MCRCAARHALCALPKSQVSWSLSTAPKFSCSASSIRYFRCDFFPRVIDRLKLHCDPLNPQE